MSTQEYTVLRESPFKYYVLKRNPSTFQTIYQKMAETGNKEDAQEIVNALNGSQAIAEALNG